MTRMATDALALCALVASLGTAPARAQDELTLGNTLATNNCAACHTFGKGEPNGQGPNLYGLLGRPLASAAGFRYSAAMKAAAPGKVWDEALLDRWLADTQAVVPGNAMTYFEGDALRRKRIVNYLRTLR